MVSVNLSYLILLFSVQIIKAAGYEISKVKYDKGLYAQCKQTTSTGSSDTADYQMAGRPREEIDYF